jgi:hypothetical protein
MTTPTGYREFTNNNAEEAMRASGITTPEILVGKEEDDGIYEGRWRFVTIFNAQDLASDTFTCIDVVTGSEVSPNFVPLSAILPENSTYPCMWTKIKIPESSSLVVIAWK